MWVMNVTPDSFSDGGQWQRREEWANHVNSFSRETIIDVGAESTAPGRNAISAEEEVDRLDRYFFQSLTSLKKSVSVSIDTYKIETMDWCLNKLKSFPQVEKVFWNDVSGVYQDNVVEMLKRFPELNYILCHNKVGSRSEVLSHSKLANANYSSSDTQKNYAIYDQVVTFFSQALRYFQQADSLLNKRIILDPAFGFAKSREENWFLIEKLPELVKTFHQQDFLIGISRKSFLRDIGKSYYDDKQAEKTLSTEALLLGQFMQQMTLQSSCHTSQKVYWRTHHPSIVELLS